jgi:T5orf172 domain
MKGIVYIFTNPAMPGIVKIGRTTRSSIETRLKELFTTGVPVPFECAIACDVDDCISLEKALHLAFNPYRINTGREFFSIEPDQAIAILKLFKPKEITEEINRQIHENTSQIDREAGEKLKKQRRPPLNFIEMGIPIGTKLKFIGDDTNKIVEVFSEKTVFYNNQEYSLTKLSRELLNLDYNVHPTPLWSIEGKSLQEFYKIAYW